MPHDVVAWGPQGVGLAVEFSQTGDRWQHGLLLLAAGQPAGGRVACRSLEGESDDAWPASPPFQNLHIEERDAGRRVALLVGLAGKSHWSLSVEPIAGEAALKFDVACRVQAQPQWLGSSYAFSRSPEAPGLHFETPDRKEQEALRCRIVPSALGEEKLPCTIRWSYVCRAIEVTRGA